MHFIVRCEILKFTKKWRFIKSSLMQFGILCEFSHIKTIICQLVRSSLTLYVDMGNYESKTSNNGQTIHPFIYSCQGTMEMLLKSLTTKSIWVGLVVLA